MGSSLKVLPALIGVDGVRALLMLDASFDGDQLVSLLTQCGVQPVGSDATGNPLWTDRSVEEKGAEIRTAFRRRMAGVDVEVLADVVREVLTAASDVTLRRALEQNLSSALDDMDGRLDKLQESAQGLFRQQGSNGQTLREVAQTCAGLLNEIRSGNAAVKKDVGAVLVKFEQQTDVLMETVAEELRAVRSALNELAKRSTV